MSYPALPSSSPLPPPLPRRSSSVPDIPCLPQRIGYADADEHLQLCSFFEAASTLAGGDKGDAALLREHAGACEVALGATHSLSALGRLAEAAGLERAGKQEEARAGLARAGKAMTASVHTVSLAIAYRCPPLPRARRKGFIH